MYTALIIVLTAINLQPYFTPLLAAACHSVISMCLHSFRKLDSD